MSSEVDEAELRIKADLTGTGWKDAQKAPEANGTWKQYSGLDVSGDFRPFPVGKNRKWAGSQRENLESSDLEYCFQGSIAANTQTHIFYMALPTVEGTSSELNPTKSR